jgi:chromosomal replication initiator protein
VKEEQAAELWKRACRHLRDILHPDVYSRWIDVITPLSFDSGKLTLAVDNDFYQTWLEENYLPLIRNAIAAEHEGSVEIAFTIRPRGAAAEAPPPAPRRPTLRERLTRRGPAERPALSSRFTFDTFVVGPSNDFAYSASRAVAQAPARAYNPLFIYGGTGLGKTHLMQAIGHHALQTARSSVHYVSCEAFVNDYIAALQNRALVEFRKKYRSVDVLLVDDIHFLGRKERMQEEFFHTFNSLFEAHKQIVMTSDRPAKEIADVEQRLVSRFEWGLVVELEAPDLETRIAILRHKLEQSHVSLPDDIVMFIAENIRSSIRALEGALVRAVSYASLTGRDLTLATLKELLKSSMEQQRTEELTFDAIQRAVAEHFDVRLADMSSQRRQRSVAMPRQVAMYLCRRMTRASLPEIASSFSKTHATVLHAHRAVTSRMDVDARLREDVSAISNKLRRPLSIT